MSIQLRVDVLQPLNAGLEQDVRGAPTDKEAVADAQGEGELGERVDGDRRGQRGEGLQEEVELCPQCQD
jgi:hypothetical protein